ncbi:glycosyltransferase [Chitinophaga horti]|uniref:Glycosyltransferase n=1 Tax=Chitinophaga horti TaxID=2920382 RepID=A0ABY6J1U4_9BACT|nr:glycosyltransferase [Chitinophaga horti]UYQ93649.1 glycosyltransferase [Chitinophaga horti]
MANRPLRVLEMNFERGWRGGERQTLYTLQGFQKAELDVRMLCRKDFPMAEKAAAEGVRVYGFKSVFGALFYLIFNGHKYDILHTQTSHFLTYCILSKPFHRAKIVFTRRVDFVPKGRMTLLKYKLTDKVVAISSAIKKIVENFSGKDVPLISSAIVGKTLNKERAVKILEEHQVPRDKKIIGTTAALVQHKDPLTMVEAIRQLAATRQDFVFLHFGKGNLEEAVRQKIAEYQLEPYYRLMGFYSEVEDVFSVLDIFAMSSEEEGLGSSVLDAFLYKVPTVSTNAGGLIDLVGEGRGIMCNVREAGKLAEGMHALLESPALRAELTEKAHHYAVTQHNIDYITSQYLQLFKTLLSSR